MMQPTCTKANGSNDKTSHLFSVSFSLSLKIIRPACMRDVLLVESQGVEKSKRTLSHARRHAVPVANFNKDWELGAGRSGPIAEKITRMGERVLQVMNI